jgi:hypothetical protein
MSSDRLFKGRAGGRYRQKARNKQKDGNELNDVLYPEEILHEKSS